MLRKLACPLALGLALAGQSLDARAELFRVALSTKDFGYLDYLFSEEGQKIIVTTNRMPAYSKVKSPESQLLEGQDVRMPDIFDIGRRYQAIGNRYREIFPGAR